MPVPIKLITDKRKDNSGIDYSFLFNSPSPEKKIVSASNKDASLLFELWSQGEKDGITDSIKILPSANITSKDILRLKSLGFIVGDVSEVRFTRKGKMVITTMALGEVSQFEKNRKQKNYTEILASMSKRNKKGYRIPKFAANGSNCLNLKGI